MEIDDRLFAIEEEIIWGLLDGFLKNAKRIPWGPTSKAVVFSDQHRGDKSVADQFLKNEDLHNQVRQSFRQDGYLLIDNGDLDDLWEFGDAPYKYYGNLHSDIRTRGNHDNKRRDLPEVVVLDSDPPILITHGHKGDPVDDQLSFIGEAAVHIWRLVDNLGIPNPFGAGSTRHEDIKEIMKRWSNARSVPLVTGHIHYAEIDGMYKNSGFWKGVGGQAIIIEGNEFKLGSWQ